MQYLGFWIFLSVLFASGTYYDLKTKIIESNYDLQIQRINSEERVKTYRIDSECEYEDEEEDEEEEKPIYWES